MSPSPSPLHQTIVLFLCQLLDPVARRTGGIVFVAPLDVLLADHSIVQPDVIYISRERRGIVGERIAGAPDLLVEVLSPHSVHRDRTEKLKLYAESGVREYWIVDPPAQQIDFFVNREGIFQVAVAVDDVYRSAQIPGIEISIVTFWNEVRARLP